MKKLLALSFFAVLILTACPNPDTSQPSTNEMINPLRWGEWRALIYPDSNKKENNLIFHINIEGKAITLNSGFFSLQDSIREKGDSVFMRLGRAEIRCKRYGDSELDGICLLGGSRLKFAAFSGYGTEFKSNQRDNLINIDGDWSLRWDSLGEDYNNFSFIRMKQMGSSLDVDFTVFVGSDSTYGQKAMFDGNRLKSSYFDGENAFIWEGRWKSAEEIKGVLWEKDSIRGMWTLTR